MGGTIGVRSWPGQGSTFWFTTPLEIGAASAVRSLEDGLRGSRILVVDPDSTSHRILARTLESWDFRVTAVGTEHLAREALLAEARTSDPFRVAIVDDGAHSGSLDTQSLGDASVPVILLGSYTAVAAPDCDTVCERLHKPPRASELLDALMRCLAGQCVPGTSTVPEVEAARSLPASARILLVEDNEVNQRVTVAMLHRIGCHVDVVDDGVAAVEACAARRHDVVLMDLGLPGMDGMEATRRIRAAERHGRHVAIIALTANASSDDRERSLAAGMDDYLSKPVRVTVLEEALARWFGPGSASSAVPACDRVCCPGPAATPGDAAPGDAGQGEPLRAMPLRAMPARGWSTSMPWPISATWATVRRTPSANWCACAATRRGRTCPPCGRPSRRVMSVEWLPWHTS